jgi:hypothetical protein
VRAKVLPSSFTLRSEPISLPINTYGYMIPAGAKSLLSVSSITVRSAFAGGDDVVGARIIGTMPSARLLAREIEQGVGECVN